MIYKRINLKAIIVFVILILITCSCGIDKNVTKGSSPLSPEAFCSMRVNDEIEVNIPQTLKDKCKVTEEKNQIIFFYRLSPEREIEFFKIMIWSHKEYEDIRKVEGESFNESYVIGQNRNHVFYFVSPVDIDLSEEELKQYGDEVKFVFSNIKEIQKKIKIL